MPFGTFKGLDVGFHFVGKRFGITFQDLQIDIAGSADVTTVFQSDCLRLETWRSLFRQQCNAIPFLGELWKLFRRFMKLAQDLQ